jgi:hypothetical protein
VLVTGKALSNRHCTSQQAGDTSHNNERRLRF